MSYRNLFSLLACLALLPILGCSSSDSLGGTAPELEAKCVVDAEDDDWLCHEDVTVQCEEGGVDPMYVYLDPSDENLEPPGELPEDCDDIELSLNNEGPFDVGTHDIVVTADAFNEDGDPVQVMCNSTLTVEDKEPPKANEEPIELWPPNHKFRTISGEDCVKDACDGDLEVTFNYASSDEPVNDKGDGNTEPDIILECDRVQLRSERQGSGNGRVYKLGWKAVDDSGNPAEGVCIVHVPHDQSGRDVGDDGIAYDMALSSQECGEGGAGGEGGDGGEGGEGGEGGAAGEGGEGGAAGEGGEVVVP